MGDSGKDDAQLSEPVRKPRGKPFAKGADPRRLPGGVSAERRAFIDRLKEDDAEEVYQAFLGLVRDGNAHAILRGMEYIARKPPNAVEDNDAVRESGKLPFTREEMLAALRGEKDQG